MSLFDNLMQSLSETAQSTVERGQHLGTIAGLQLNLKKLQLERARQMYELGQRTHAWHNAGTLTVAGHVPEDLVAICLQIDDMNRDIDVTQHQIDAERQRLEAVKLQAEVDRMKARETRYEAAEAGSAARDATEAEVTVRVVPPGTHTDASR